MRLIQTAPDKLDDPEERLIAKLAIMAQNDTYWGGASALVLAKQLESTGELFDAESVVSAGLIAQDDPKFV